MEFESISNERSQPVKVLVIGNSGVGKTSLCRRYVDQTYAEKDLYKPTIGVDFCSKEFMSKENNKYIFQFWDIGGQDRFINMSHIYYKDSDFCLILFDVTNRKSFEECAKWKLDLDEKYRMIDDSKCPCLLIGNKCDEMAKREVDQEEIMDMCNLFEFFGYMEISVKNNIMVKETVDYISNIIMEKKETMSTKYDILINKSAFNLVDGPAPRCFSSVKKPYRC